MTTLHLERLFWISLGLIAAGCFGAAAFYLPDAVVAFIAAALCASGMFLLGLSLFIAPKGTNR